MFTKTDRNLLLRVARILRADAAELFAITPDWGDSKKSKSNKRQHDRLLRDARDLFVLSQTVEKHIPEIPASPAAIGDGIADDTDAIQAGAPILPAQRLPLAQPE